MSLPVAVDDLRASIAERGPGAYVLTVTDEGRPHAVHAITTWEGDCLVVEVGRRTAANVRARPQISLLFPLRREGDYSLIVDGRASVTSGDKGGRLLVRPTTAVLHRAAVGPDPASECGSDCLPPGAQPARG